MSDIIERLRKTASRGVSVWGDLQMEAADELERLRAEIAKPALEPVEFLMYGARFKLNFNGKGNCTTFQNLVHDLQGRWVALVSAENDKHLANAQPAPAVREPQDAIDAARYRWLLQTRGNNLHGKPSLEAAWDDDIDDYRGAWFFGLDSDAAIDSAIDVARGITGDSK